MVMFVAFEQYKRLYRVVSDNNFVTSAYNFSLTKQILLHKHTKKFKERDKKRHSVFQYSHSNSFFKRNTTITRSTKYLDVRKDIGQDAHPPVFFVTVVVVVVVFDSSSSSDSSPSIPQPSFLFKYRTTSPSYSSSPHLHPIRPRPWV